MIMILAAVLILGAVSLFRLPQALLPDIDYPYALTMVTYTGAGPEEVDSLITTPIEETFASVEGVQEMYSMTSEGVSVVMLEFDMDTDMNFATLDMREKLSLCLLYTSRNSAEQENDDLPEVYQDGRYR